MYALKKKKIILLNIHRSFDVYKSSSNSPYIEAIPQFRVSYGKLPNSDVEYTVYDKKFSLTKGIVEISLRKLPDSYTTMLQNRGVEIKGKLVEQCSPFDVKSELLKIKNWTEWLDTFIDNTGMKDEKIKNIALSHMMPVFFQELNNHAIFLTNTMTGKSITYTIITGVPPSVDISYAGLIGTYDRKTGTISYGELSGGGIFAMDEFPERNDPIANKILDYLESGESIRSLERKIKCTGSKVVIFLGNYSELSYNDFKENLIGLATSKAMDRIGRRFAHVIYGDLNIVEPLPRSKDEQFRRTLIRYSIEKIKYKLKWLYMNTKIQKWIHSSDVEYSSELSNLRLIAKHKSMSQFIKGCEYAIPRLKMGSLKRALMDFLPQLVLNRNYIDLLPSIIDRSHMYYSKFKQYNLDSLYNLEYDKKLEFKQMMEMNTPKEDIIRDLKISEKTYYLWKNDFQQS